MRRRDRDRTAPRGVAATVLLLAIAGARARRRRRGHEHHEHDHDEHHAAGAEDDPPGVRARARDLDPGDLLGGSRPRAAPEPVEALRAERGRRPVGARRAPGAVARRRLRHDRCGHTGRSAHTGDDGECLEASEPFGLGTAREEMARRIGVAAERHPGVVDRVPRRSTRSSATTTACCSTPRSARSATRWLPQACARAAIGNGDTTLTPTRRRRLPAVGAARADRPERDRARRCGRLVAARTRSEGAVRAAAGSRPRARRVRPGVGRRAGNRAVRGGRGQRSPADADVRARCSTRRTRAAMQQHVLRGSTIWSAACCSGSTPRTTR